MQKLEEEDEGEEEEPKRSVSGCCPKITSFFEREATLRPFHTVDREYAPPWSLVDYPYIERGFINSGYPLWQCLYSFITPTNETTNVYTQVIGMCVFIYCFVVCEESPDDSTEMMWLRVSLFSNLIVCLASTLCHLLQSKSQCHRDVLSVGDWGSILLVGLTASGGLNLSNVCPVHYRWICVIHFVQSLVLCAAFCAFLYFRQTTHTFRFGSMFAVVAFCALPLLFQLTQRHDLSKPCLTGVICFLIGGFFFSSHYPERKWKRKYDIIASSHTLWHIWYQLGLFFLTTLLAQILLKRVPWF